MPTITLTDALRYFFAPFVLFFYLVVFDPALATRVQSVIGPVGVIAFLVSGTVLYFLYRYLIYDTIILWLHDIFRRETYRRYFGELYGIRRGKYWLPTCTIRAMRLYAQIRFSIETFQRDIFRLRASGIHLLYQAGLLAIPFAILSVPKDRFRLSFFLFVTLLLSFTAALADRNHEEEELLLMKERPDEIDRAAALLGYSRKDDTPVC